VNARRLVFQNSDCERARSQSEETVIGELDSLNRAFYADTRNVIIKARENVARVKRSPEKPTDIVKDPMYKDSMYKDPIYKDLMYLEFLGLKRE
jgi:hypothetical protein